MPAVTADIALQLQLHIRHGTRPEQSAFKKLQRGVRLIC